MNVAYFGTGARRLFGIYEPPPSTIASTRGVVLCPAWGSEYLMSHRSLRRLALMLTARGMHVLRFDYFGTGDSAGDMADASLAGYQDDIRSAIDELREMSHAPNIGLLGLRVGADLAAQVAASGSHQLSEIVLWDPVVSGRDYLAELTLKREAPAARGDVKPGDAAAWTRFVNAWGFAISDQTRAEFAAMDLLPLLDGLPDRTLIATSAEQHPLAHPHGVATTRRVPLQFQNVVGPSAWNEEGNLGAAAIPTPLLKAITAWLTPE